MQTNRSKALVLAVKQNRPLVIHAVFGGSALLLIALLTYLA